MQTHANRRARIRSLAPAALILCALVSPGGIHAQAGRRPLSKDDVIRLLKGDVSPKRVGEMARERGIDFELTPGVESELRQAGATESLLDTLRELAPKPSAPPVLEIQSTPGHAQVYVDDELRGSTSAEGRLVIPNVKPGAHKLRVSLDHYADSEQTARLMAGQVATVTVKLETAKPPSPSSPTKSTVPKRIRVGGQFEEAKLIYHPAPDYPPLAKMARIQGVVRLEAIIDKDGTIRELKAINGHPLLVKPALEAVSRWRYQPTLLNGEPVQVVTEIAVNFTLKE